MDYLICVTDFSICNTDYPICVTDFSICNTDYPIMLQIEHFDKNIYPFISCLFLSELSPHPYIFFNPDHATMTFLGFQVDQNGNLLDPRPKKSLSGISCQDPFEQDFMCRKWIWTTTLSLIRSRYS